MIASVAFGVCFLMAYDVFNGNVEFLAKIHAIVDCGIADDFEIRPVIQIVFAHFKLNVCGVVIVRTL